jgi:hypothetical protein
MFERPVVIAMEVDEKRHDLAQGQRGLSLAVALAGLEEVSSIHRCKRLAEIGNITEHSNALQLAHRDPLVVLLIRG